MQFFFVKKNIVLRSPHKRRTLLPVSEADLSANQIPLENIYCGNIAWEVIDARRQVGDHETIVIPNSHQIQQLLPKALEAYSPEGGLMAQLREVARTRHHKGSPLRLALVNGFGTMLGDTLVGTSALELAMLHLGSEFDKIQIHAVLAWNARKGAESILSRCPAIHSIQEHSITLHELRKYDAYWDFSALLSMPGYDQLPLIDFYLQHLGVNPSAIAAALKRTVLRLPRELRTEASCLLEQRTQGRKVILIQAQSSTALRSMPDFFLGSIVEHILANSDCCILFAQTYPEELSQRCNERIIDVADWSKASSDRYLALVTCADAVLSVDSLAIHVATAASIPGVAIFTTMPPVLRLAYATSTLVGITLPGAENLPTWGLHKDDTDWPTQQTAYNDAWQALDQRAIVEILVSQIRKA